VLSHNPKSRVATQALGRAGTGEACAFKPFTALGCPHSQTGTGRGDRYLAPSRVGHQTERAHLSGVKRKALYYPSRGRGGVCWDVKPLKSRFLCLSPPMVRCRHETAPPRWSAPWLTLIFALLVRFTARCLGVVENSYFVFSLFLILYESFSTLPRCGSGQGLCRKGSSEEKVKRKGGSAPHAEGACGKPRCAPNVAVNFQ
jgi:hypothetical protein